MADNNDNSDQKNPEQMPVENGGDNGNGKKKRSNFHVRTLTALFIAVLYVAPILLGLYIYDIFYDALVVFLMVVAAFEFSRAIAIKFPKPVNIFVYANIVAGYAAFKLVSEFGRGQGGITAFFGVLAVTFIACIVFTMCNKNYEVGNAISTLFVMIYPTTIMVYTLGLAYFMPEAESSITGLAVFGSQSINAILLLFICTTLTDTMAYFVGSTVKGPKLCPKISPKKTVEGAIGGTLGGIVASVLVGYLIQPVLGTSVSLLHMAMLAKNGALGCAPITAAVVPNVLHFLVLGLGTSLFCQIGDLISSYVKRSCGIKDFGNFLKGHGGFMDRIDGLIISAVFLYIYFTILGVVL